MALKSSLIRIAKYSSYFYSFFVTTEEFSKMPGVTEFSSNYLTSEVSFTKLCYEGNGYIITEYLFIKIFIFCYNFMLAYFETIDINMFIY